MTSSAIAFPRSIRWGDYQGNVFHSERSGFGLYLRRMGTFPTYTGKLTLLDTEASSANCSRYCASPAWSSAYDKLRTRPTCLATRYQPRP